MEATLVTILNGNFPLDDNNRDYRIMFVLFIQTPQTIGW